MASLTLDDVITSILPETRREFPAGEVCQMLSIRPITLSLLRGELEGQLRFRSGVYPRSGLVKFFRSRWLGSEALRATRISLHRKANVELISLYLAVGSLRQREKPRICPSGKDSARLAEFSFELSKQKRGGGPGRPASSDPLSGMSGQPDGGRLAGRVLAYLLIPAERKKFL